jgi:hypothetical protein
MAGGPAKVVRVDELRHITQRYTSNHIRQLALLADAHCIRIDRSMIITNGGCYLRYLLSAYPGNRPLLKD